MTSFPHKTISLSRRLTLCFACVLTAMVIVVGGFYYYLTISQLEKNYSKKLENTLTVISGALGPVLWTLDQPTLEKVADMAMKNELVQGLTVKDHKDRPLFHAVRNHDRDTLVQSRPVYFKNNRVGTVEATFSKRSLAVNQKTIYRLSFLFWLISLCCILIFTKLFIHRFFQGPIGSFTDLIESYRQQGELTLEEPTPFLEFQPIERLVKNLTDTLFEQMMALKKNEERLALAMQFANDGLFDWNLTTDQVYFSPGWKRLLGYEDHEIKNNLSEWKRLVSPGDDEKSRAILNDLLEGRRERFVAEIRMRHKQGHWVDILSRANVIRDEKRNTLRVVGTHVDITERKQAEQRLKESEKRFRTLFETAPSVILLLSPEARILDLNPKAERFHQCRRSELLGQDFSRRFIREADRKTFIKTIGTILEKKSQKSSPKRSPGEFETTLIIQEGDERQMLWNAAPFSDDGHRPASILCMGQDITERKRIDFQLQQAQKMEAIGTLAGGIAHDFNNMLGIIMGNISLGLVDMDPEDELYELLSDAQEGTIRAQGLTQQLLTFSKGGAPVKKAENLNKLIRESARFVMRGAKSKCRFTLPETLWAVDADKGQVGQVIQNLLINANQAMPHGGLVTVTTENLAVDDRDGLPLPGGPYVRISVEDQGVGISKKHLSMIFDPFFTTKQRGSGLGLAISYSIIQRHGGHITAYSELDRGTCFHIYLPASMNRPEHIPARQAVSFGEQGKILVMDDQKALRKLAGQIIKQIGFDTVFAQDGAEAVDTYRRAFESHDLFDLVILDLTVPGGMGGVETLAELKKINPKVKAVVSSGYATDPVMANYDAYGFCGVIPKPYTTDQLTRTLARVLG